METDVNSIRQCETVTGAANNRPRLNVVDPAPWRFKNSSSFEIIWISHEFWIYGIQLVLISGVNFYFVSRKETIVEVLTIQSLYCSFICFLRTIYLTDHFIYFTDRLNGSLLYLVFFFCSGLSFSFFVLFSMSVSFLMMLIVCGRKLERIFQWFWENCKFNSSFIVNS
jgi:hypothetical protein